MPGVTAFDHVKKIPVMIPVEIIANVSMMVSIFITAVLIR